MPYLNYGHLLDVFGRADFNLLKLDHILVYRMLVHQVADLCVVSIDDKLGPLAFDNDLVLPAARREEALEL